MENAVKALLIAASMLMLVLIISLVVIAYGQTSGFFQREHENIVVEQLKEFNEEFDNYKNTTIRGNEMLSIINKVIDYNTIQAGNKGYEKITLEIEGINSSDDLKLFKYESSDTSILILNGDKIKSDGSEEISRQINKMLNKLSEAGISGVTEPQLQTLVANISDVLIENDTSINQDRNIYNLNIRNRLIENVLGVDANTVDIDEIQEVTRQYYQLVQFKKANFKCTDIKHSKETGRVIEMKFEIVKEDGIIKFD